MPVTPVTPVTAPPDFPAPARKPGRDTHAAGPRRTRHAPVTPASHPQRPEFGAGGGETCRPAPVRDGCDGRDGASPLLFLGGGARDLGRVSGALAEALAYLSSPAAIAGEIARLEAAIREGDASEATTVLLGDWRRVQEAQARLVAQTEEEAR